MDVLNKSGIFLVSVFATCLVAVFAQLVYALCRRRSLRRRSVGDPEIAGDSSFSPSKELLYLFCCKNQARVEPAAPTLNPTPGAADSEDEVAEWQLLHGASRILYTIREEDEKESENSPESEVKRRICLGDALAISVVSEKEQEEIGGACGDDQSEEATPFATPGTSPPYFTPSPSPSRDAVVMLSPEGGDRKAGVCN